MCQHTYFVLSHLFSRRKRFTVVIKYFTVLTSLMGKTTQAVVVLTYAFIFETPCIIQLINGTVYKMNCPFWPRLPILNQVQGSLGTILFFFLLLAILSSRHDWGTVAMFLLVLVSLIYLTQVIISLYTTIAYFVESRKNVMQSDNATLSSYCHPKFLDYTKATSITEIVLEIIFGGVLRANRGQ